MRLHLYFQLTFSHCVWVLTVIISIPTFILWFLRASLCAHYLWKNVGFYFILMIFSLIFLYWRSDLKSEIMVRSDLITRHIYQIFLFSVFSQDIRVSFFIITIWVSIKWLINFHLVYLLFFLIHYFFINVLQFNNL